MIQNRFAALFVLFISIMAGRADDAFSFVKLGGAAIAQTNYDLAIIYYNDAIKSDPQYGLAFMGRGYAYMKKMQHTNAVQDCQEAIKMSVDNSAKGVAFGLLGTIYFRAHQVHLAISNYTECINISPEKFGGYVDRADALVVMGQFDAAIRDCDKAFSLKPDESRIFRAKADAETGKGDYSKAIADYDRALKLNPSDYLSYNGRAQSFAGMGNYDRASEDEARAMELSETNAVRLATIGELYLRAGDSKMAIKAGQEAVRLDPDYALGINNLAWALAVAPDKNFRDGPQAVEYALKACEMADWSNSSYIGTLAAAYAEAGNFAEAIKWQKVGIELESQPDLLEKLKSSQKRLKLYQADKPFRETVNSK